jgi:cytosine/adenosine deaminase-related metal-dependent hydrolase
MRNRQLDRLLNVIDNLSPTYPATAAANVEACRLVNGHCHENRSEVTRARMTGSFRLQWLQSAMLAPPRP